MARAPSTGTQLRNWFYGYAAPERGAITLGHRRVYILPTRLGWMFGATLGLLLVGSINYALQLGFALTFLLAGMGLAGMVHTVRNLARLTIDAGRAEPVFAGEAAQFRLTLDNRAPHDRPAVLVRHAASRAQGVLDLPAASAREAVLAVPAPHRGWLPLGRVVLETRYPLGLFRAWSHVEPDVRCLVYPRPERAPLPAPAAADEAGAQRAHAMGSDDFAGLRGYQLQDSPRHVAWKAVARSRCSRCPSSPGWIASAARARAMPASTSTSRLRRASRPWCSPIRARCGSFSAISSRTPRATRRARRRACGWSVAMPPCA